MRLLVRREHARDELLRKLIRRGFESSICDTVLDELVAEGALSDERFAHAYVNYRRERGFGPLRIHEELRKRGIDADLRECSCPISDPEWITRACALRYKRYGAAVPSDYADRVQQSRYLTQRGFNASQVSIAVQTSLCVAQ